LPEVVAAPVVVLEPPVVKSIEPKKPSALEKVAREKLALGPTDLVAKVSQKVMPPKCRHTPVVTKQVWVKVASKKYELQNEVLCTSCKEVANHPIS
jgi:hypothetical protein